MTTEKTENRTASWPGDCPQMLHEAVDAANYAIMRATNGE